MKCSNGAMSWNAWDVSMSLFPVLCVFSMYSDETIMASAIEIPLGNPWKWHFRDSKNFQNVPRCLSPKKLAPLVRVPKPPTIHYQPATWKLFDSPGFEPIRNGEIFWMSNNVTETRVSLRKHPFLLALRRWGHFARRNVSDSATQRQKFHTDDVKSVQNPVRSADWSTQQLHFLAIVYEWQTKDKRPQRSNVNAKNL